MKIISIAPQKQGCKQCVISLGIGRPTYIECLKRLEQSLRRVAFAGDFLVWADELPAGSPTQFEAPMAFKTFCFNEAKTKGYEQVLWIDSPMIALRSLEPVFNLLNQHKYIAFNNNYGQTLGQWCSDEVLAKHHISREKALQIPEVPTSAIGLDFNSQLGNTFLDRWHNLCNDGLTCRGTTKEIVSAEDYYAITWNKNGCISSDQRVGGHRHDQTAAGIVADQMGLLPYATNLRDIHYKTTPIDRNTVLLHHREFGDKITPLERIVFHAFWREPFYERPRAKFSKVLNQVKSSTKAIIKPWPKST